MSALSSSENMVTAHIDPSLYKSATNGNFEPFESYEQGLDHLLFGKNNNSILHLHLNSPCERSKRFVEKALGQCPNLLWQINTNGDIPLHIAAKYGHVEVVRLLIEEAKRQIHRDSEAGEEEAAVRRMLRVRNNQHESALHLAITSGRDKSLSLVKELLEHEDAKYTYSPNKCGESPLYLAVDNHLSDVAIEISKKFESLDPNGPNGTTVFHAAIFLYNKGLWDELCSKFGSVVNQADEKGWAPLHCAAYLGVSKIVRRILENDTSSAYATDKERNRTALHMATIVGNIDIMKEMMDKCPECCDITDDRGWNVLHYAVIGKCGKAVETIMNHPSFMYLIDEQDVKGYTPMHLLIGTHNLSSLHSWLMSLKLPVSSEFLWKRMSFCLRSIRFDEDTYKKEIEEWIKDLGNDPVGDKIELVLQVKKRVKEMTEKVIPDLEKAKDSHLVAAALVATVTFAAAFTLPGGYISDGDDSKLNGSPILSRNAAFKAFVVTDAVAMVLSTSSVFIHFIMVLLGYKQRYYWLIRSAFWFIVLAMGAMVVAFVAGTYAVLAPNSMNLAIATCVIGLTFFVHVFYTSMRLVSDFIKRDKVEHNGSTTSQSLGRLWNSAPQYLSCGCYWFNWRYWRFIYNKSHRWLR